MFIDRFGVWRKHADVCADFPALILGRARVRWILARLRKRLALLFSRPVFASGMGIEVVSHGSNGLHIGEAADRQQEGRRRHDE